MTDEAQQPAAVEVPNVVAGDAPAPLAMEPSAIAPDAVSTGVEPASVEPSSLDPAAAGPGVTEVPNVVAETAANPSSPPSTESAASTSAGEDPNAALPAAGSSAVEQASAPSAAGVDTTSPTAASSVEPADDPLHVLIAGHLEAIYLLAKSSVEAPITPITKAATDVKSHIGDVLHKIRNGIGVAEGELVQKLESLFHML